MTTSISNNMQIHINTKSTNASAAEANNIFTTCHILPCKVKFTGPTTDALKYFKVTEDKDDLMPTTVNATQDLTEKADTNSISLDKASVTYVAHFRGRKLKGVPINVPEGYMGQCTFA